MKKARFEDRRLGFTSDVNGEFTLKGAKVNATKGKETSASFAFVTCRKKDGKGKSLFIGAGDLQVTALEAGLKGDQLPFPSVEMDTDVDVETLKPNENFVFAVLNNQIICKKK